eukprot:scaffold34490_cov47-Prasinocladus_malaysianus.AAC.3
MALHAVRRPRMTPRASSSARDPRLATAWPTSPPRAISNTACTRPCLANASWKPKIPGQPFNVAAIESSFSTSDSKDTFVPSAVEVFKSPSCSTICMTLTAQCLPDLRCTQWCTVENAPDPSTRPMM